MNIESVAFAAEGSQLCRLCLRIGQEVSSIFSGNSGLADAQSLAVRINEFLQLQILQNDNLPEWICKECHQKIDDFTSFRAQCKQNDLNLRLAQTEEQNHLKFVIGELFPDGVPYDEDGRPMTDDEETETIVIDPTRDYESSNQSLPNHRDREYADHFVFSTVVDDEREHLASGAEAEEDINGSLAEDLEDEEEDEEDRFDAFPADSRIGLAYAGSTNAGQQKTAVFTCKYCDVAFAASSACQLHEMQDHDLLAPYGCLYCSYKTAIRMSLISHIRESHSMCRPYVCVQCNKGFLRRSDLKKHTFVHTGVRPYGCDQCGKSFSRNTNLTKHMRIHSGLKPHACHVCPRSFANKADLVRHQKIHSGQGSQFSCPRCGNTYARKDKLYSHERSCLHRKLATLDTGHGPFTGESMLLQPSVKSEFQFPLGLSPHIPECMPPEKPAPVELTADPIVANFPNMSLPAPTLISPTPRCSKIYNCTKCPKRFLSKASLRAHQASHSSEENAGTYECPQCRKQFVGKRELERHLMTHSDMKPFGCETCGKKFSRKDKLQRHQRVHQRVRHFACPNCDAKFRRKDALASHLKIHCMPASVGSYEGGAGTTTTAPFSSLVQEQMTPHVHSTLYMVGDDSAAFDSVRI